ncbi:hypothetical protein DFH11DRAFT_1506802, partial [Phellopilus nigrolimitatus]
SLQRGKACITCRRRKMKCDGMRPFCTQCTSGNRAKDCEYTDNQGRTRTAMLEENIALLQARIDELENNDPSSQPILLYDPYEPYKRASESPTGYLGLDSSSIQDGRMFASPMRSDSALSSLWWESEELPAEISNMLVVAFLPHASALGFALSPERFLDDLSLPILHPGRPHAALLYAVILWAVRFSQVPDFMQHEGLFLQRAIIALHDDVSGSLDKLDSFTLAKQRVHAIQAEILLSQFFFSVGRLFEGRCHANAAVSLAVSCGLYHINTTSRDRSKSTSSCTPSHTHDASTATGAEEFSSHFQLADARDALELGEQIRIFWAVYAMDRCWSVALQAPCFLSDDPALGTQIDTPWPQDIEEYGWMSINFLTSTIAPSRETVKRFLAKETVQINLSGSSSNAALWAKASALYERAFRLTARWHSTPQHDKTRIDIQTDMQALALITTVFAQELTALDQLDSNIYSAGVRQTLFVVHGLAHATMIQLHDVRASLASSGDIASSNATLEHASEVVSILELASNSGFEEKTSIGLVDPVHAVSISIYSLYVNEDPAVIFQIISLSAARVFICEYNRTRHEFQTKASCIRRETLRAFISRIMKALNRCAGVTDSCSIFCAFVFASLFPLFHVEAYLRIVSQPSK